MYTRTFRRFNQGFYIRNSFNYTRWLGNSNLLKSSKRTKSANKLSYNKLFKQLTSLVKKNLVTSNYFKLFRVTKILFFRFFLAKLRLHLFTGFDIIKHALCYYLSPLILLQPNSIILVGLNDLTLDARFISTFIAYYLESRYYLNQILKVLWVYLDRAIKNRLLYGYQVKLSGRFKKNEKAVYMMRKVGNIGRYDIKRFVDYSYSTARMRLGVTGIKV